MPNIPENGPVSYCCRLEHVLVCPPGAHRANIAITVTLGMPPYDMIEHARNSCSSTSKERSF